MNTHVIKQNGRRASEHFSEEKLHASVRAACRSVRAPEGEATTIAEHVVQAVSQWREGKSAITSADIRRIATRGLEIFHPEAAYLYQNHEIVV